MIVMVNKVKFVCILSNRFMFCFSDFEVFKVSFDCVVIVIGRFVYFVNSFMYKFWNLVIDFWFFSCKGFDFFVNRIKIFI